MLDFLLQEFGIVDFGQERSGPMNVNGYVPGVNSSGSPTVIQPDSNSKTMESLVAAGKVGGFIRLKNKAPEWDEQLRGHVLNFKVNIVILKLNKRRGNRNCCMGSGRHSHGHGSVGAHPSSMTVT